MSGALVGFLFGAGVSAWVYNYFYRQTGGNVKTASIVAGIAGVFGFTITFFAYNAFAN